MPVEILSERKMRIGSVTVTFTVCRIKLDEPVKSSAAQAGEAERIRRQP